MVSVTALAVLGFVLGFVYGMYKRAGLGEALLYGVVTAILLPILIYVAMVSLALLLVIIILVLILQLLGWKPFH
jgi:hypothetical protein